MNQLKLKEGVESPHALLEEFYKVGYGLMIYRGEKYLMKEALIAGARRKYPDLRIETELMAHGDITIVRATVQSLNANVKAQGFGTASKADTQIKRLVEMAETRAINRAIRHLFGLPTTFEEIKEEAEETRTHQDQRRTDRRQGVINDEESTIF